MTRVLIVDDSLTVRAQTKKQLSEVLENPEFVLASSGEEAVEKLEQEYDLYILDYNMEGMTGLELAEKILEKDSASKLYLCTANSQEYVKSKCDEMGIQFMEKPLDVSKVVQAFKIGA